MKKLRYLFLIFAFLAAAPIVVEAALQSQQAQIAVTIIVNVTPNPLGYTGKPAIAGNQIVATAKLRGAPPEIERVFEAQQLHFVPKGAEIVAQAQVQHAIKVEAEVTPNPNATLLTSDASGYQVILNAEAGTPTSVPCAYHVQVKTTKTGWTLKHGLAGNFSNGGSDSFVGSSLANNSHVGPTPLPTATPFVVYSTDGGVWAVLQTNSGTQTYCVDLTLNMPITTAQGTYSSNAIYTLYY